MLSRGRKWRLSLPAQRRCVRRTHAAQADADHLGPECVFALRMTREGTHPHALAGLVPNAHWAAGCSRYSSPDRAAVIALPTRVDLSWGLAWRVWHGVARRGTAWAGGHGRPCFAVGWRMGRLASPSGMRAIPSPTRPPTHRAVRSRRWADSRKPTTVTPAMIRGSGRAASGRMGRRPGQVTRAVSMEWTRRARSPCTRLPLHCR